jgi:hypothetical protein
MATTTTITMKATHNKPRTNQQRIACYPDPHDTTNEKKDLDFQLHLTKQGLGTMNLAISLPPDNTLKERKRVSNGNKVNLLT